MWVDLATPLTQDRFGALVGVSQAAVADLVARGVLARGAPGHAWLIAYIGHLRDQASGRLEAAAVADERRRLLAARAAKAELELAEQRGQLVRAADVEGATFKAWRTVRDSVVAIPARLAAQLAGESAASRCGALLDHELRAALARVSDEVGRGSAGWIAPLSGALGREIEAWARSARPDVPQDVEALRVRLARLCDAFATDRLPNPEDNREELPCPDTVTP